MRYFNKLSSFKLVEDFMSILDTMVNSIPVAPLKICALPGCEEKAIHVEEYLKGLQSKLLSLKKSPDTAYHYNSNSFIIDCECPRFEAVKPKARSNSLSEVLICLFWQMYAITASPIKCMTLKTDCHPMITFKTSKE